MEKLSHENFEQLASIDGGYFWFQGRLLWVRSLIERFSSGCLASSLRYADLGCGTGQLAKQISEYFKFKKTFLVDGHQFSAPQLGNSHQYQFVHLDLEAPFNLKEKFDVITCLDVLEHLKKEQEFLTHVKAHLEHHGLLVLTVPAFAGLFSSWDKLWGHHRRYSKSELTELLRANGYQVLFASYFWSFLFPMAILRKFKKGIQSEFPPVNKGLNQFLIGASRLELAISKYFRLPLGTSLILIATPKES